MRLLTFSMQLVVRKKSFSIGISPSRWGVSGFVGDLTRIELPSLLHVNAPVVSVGSGGG